MEIENLRLSLSKLKVKCSRIAYYGLSFVRCFVIPTHEDVVTDHLLVSKESVKVLDKRE